ncbi:MAG TPA: heme-binding protein [Steroidobacteraceae bacterium]|nr:heme-binding protein [Steroidobacteraceae bacterium]
MISVGWTSGSAARREDTPITGFLISVKKAKTSALWRRPTETFQEAVKSGRNTSYADGSFSDMTTSPGGVPIFKDGRVVGGFGVAAVGSLAASKQIDAAVSAEMEKIFGKQ